MLSQIFPMGLDGPIRPFFAWLERLEAVEGGGIYLAMVPPSSTTLFLTHLSYRLEQSRAGGRQHLNHQHELKESSSPQPQVFHPQTNSQWLAERSSPRRIPPALRPPSPSRPTSCVSSLPLEVSSSATIPVTWVVFWE
jgi:hypothetical protein